MGFFIVVEFLSSTVPSAQFWKLLLGLIGCCWTWFLVVTLDVGSSASSLERLFLNIQPVVVVRGVKRQQTAALTNFVGLFLLTVISFFSLLLSTLNDLTGRRAGP